MFDLKKTILAAALAIGYSTSANAIAITYDSILDGDGVSTTTVGSNQATVVDFNDGTCGAYTSCVGNYTIVSGDLVNRYAAPYISATGLDDTTNYLSVPQDRNLDPDSITLTIPTDSNYFGLLWGSIDDYNSIAFFYDDVLVASFTGSDVAVPASGNQTEAATNTYVNFFDLPMFNSVVLTSTRYAFESDNHAFGTVPEPSVLGLLGVGLAGLGFAASRRRKQAA